MFYAGFLPVLIYLESTLFIWEGNPFQKKKSNSFRGAISEGKNIASVITYMFICTYVYAYEFLLVCFVFVKYI